MSLLNSLKACVIALWLGDTKLRQLERNYYALGMFCLSILLAYGNDNVFVVWFPAEKLFIGNVCVCVWSLRFTMSMRCNWWLTVKTVTNTQPREQSILTMVTYSKCTSSIRFPMGMSSENKIAVCVHIHTNTRAHIHKHICRVYNLHILYKFTDT